MLNSNQLVGLCEIVAGIVSFDNSDSSESHRRIIKTVLEIVEKELTFKQNRIIYCIYFKGMTMSETADMLGVSVPAVSRVHKRAINRIRQYVRYSSLRS